MSKFDASVPGAGLSTFILMLLAFVASPALAQIGPIVSPGGGSGFASGGTATGCTAYSLVYVDSGGLLACALAPTNGNVSTAGRGIFKVLDTITGASATSNFLNITGTFPATQSAATNGASLIFTGDNDNQIQTGLNVELTPIAGVTTAGQYAIRSTLHAGVSVNSETAAGWFLNETTAGSSAWIVGVRGESLNNVSSQFLDGAVGIANSGAAGQVTRANGGSFWGSGASGSGSLRGVLGLVSDAGTNVAGGEFKLISGAATPSALGLPPAATGGKVALVADNTSIAANIFEARDNGTATFTVGDGGNLAVAKTMTAGGTTGAQTINKAMGSVNLAAAASTLVVTNSLASATSAIFLTPQTADATCTAFAAVRAAGSFTITANAACTAETAVAFLLVN